MNISVFLVPGLLLCLVAGLNVALSQETSITHTNSPQRDVCIDESMRRFDGLQTILNDQKLQVEQLFSSMAERFQSQLLLLLQSQQHIQQNQLVQQQQLDERLQQINKTQELHLQQIGEQFSSQQTQLIQQLQSQQQQIQQHHQAQQAQQQQLDERLEQFNETMLSYQQQLDGHLSDIHSQQTQQTRLIESKTHQVGQQLLQIQQKLGNTSHSTRNMPTLPRDCMDVKANGYTLSGVYTIYVDSCQRPVSVYCDMATEGGGWLVFQRRQDGRVNFYRPWADYAAGFGNLAGEFWLGNDLLHVLTAGKSYRLRIDMSDLNDTMANAEYSNFVIDSAHEKYKLTSLGTYSGTAGNSLSGHVGYKFSTFDQDNDVYSGECAVSFKGAWWYSNCHSSNLNGLYLNGSHASYADGIEWQAWTGYHYSLKFIEMKIKPTAIP